ncbi:autotransporter assembly complex protein TamA [Alterisphingorhabdus coralli]|uniref:BamA/TamA family outer membrane protein n=1 Tax=Alterisphingorhabdus coralli TaxID=3071408 RepID=A0AA97F7B4_9SPHN|nr:BamA/TamA family outer membrane protein [Parasphingorhabdus sp. SCSIO 66989]WOE74588.1 BamA/TamA family outer membrane protein [Parasphingorhabdus sp. SCSIO 66989]
MRCAVRWKIMAFCATAQAWLSSYLVKQPGRALAALALVSVTGLGPALAQETRAPEAEQSEPASTEPDAPAADDSDDLQPMMMDDDFGIEWPEFDAPVQQDEAQQELVAPETPELVQDLPEAVADGTVQDTDEVDTDLAPEMEEVAADISDNEDDATGEVAQSIAEDIRNTAGTYSDVTSLDRKFNNFRLVIDYADDLMLDKDRRALAQRFDMLSALEQADDDDNDLAQLRRRADRDRDLLTQLLRIYGHYDGYVQQVIETDSSGEADLAVTFTIEAGPHYSLKAVDLGNLDSVGADYPFLLDRFGLKSGNLLNSYDIVGARDNLAEALAENGYAFATLDPPNLLIDHAAETGALSLLVEPGRKYVFGDIRVGDDPLLDAEHLALIARFDSGDVYRRSRIQDLRRAILATGLVSSVDIAPVRTDSPPDKPATRANEAAPQAPDAQVDLAVDIVPAPLRTVAGEIGFGTGEGFRVAASWEHRNLFPPEGMLQARTIIGTQEQLLGATFRRNNFRRRDQILTFNALAANVQRDAFDARTLLVSAFLQRQTNLIFQKKWAWSVGLELILTDESDIVGAIDPTGRRTFGIAALPLTLAYDDSNDLLDPTTGFRLSGFLSPEISWQSGVFGYERTQIDGSFYQPASDNITIAGRIRLASIAGANALDIAPSRRFYAGGGGSIRGYGFQDVGPRDVNGDPIGGRSLAEFSLEARIRFGNFGVVPFVDAGNVYSDALPTFGGLRYGAGLGLRYYSSFGPLRLDVGTPINPRPGDANIGVYVSLGQAF